MESLRSLIGDRIQASGPISFAEFMELALYHPELGYYARAAQRSGRAGDFFTSVDVGPLFGELLSKQFAEMWRLMGKGVGCLFPPTEPKKAPDPFFDLVEAGAGNGRLARDILDAAQRTDPDFYASIRLSLVEQSAAARAEQAATLGPHASLLAHSSSALPAGIRGVIIANELLDALPTRAVTMTEHGLREIFVDCQDGQFVETVSEPSTPRIADYLSRAGATMSPGWRAEVNLAAEDWIKDAADALTQGFLVVIDYGHEDRDLYGESHSTGTLTTFRRHTTGAEKRDANLPAACLEAPGECDITAHVDLTSVTTAAERAGMTVLGRLDQTYFVLGLLMDDLKHEEHEDPRRTRRSTMPEGAGFDAAALRHRLALKTLMLPGGLGSTHKVLIFGKDVGTPALKGCSYRMRIT